MSQIVTLAISLPINGTAFDRAEAICAAITAATTRGDSLGAMALGQLYGDLRSGQYRPPTLVFDPNSASGFRVYNPAL